MFKSGEEASQVLLKAKEIVYEVGDFIRNQRNKVKNDDIEVKDINSLVSYVDKTAEEMLVEKLSQILPEAGFITEENTISQTQKSLTWVIDPLDGTTNFLHDIPIFSVSVALLENQVPILGIVYEIVGDEMFTAIKGQGAQLNGQPIKVTNESYLANVVIGTGYPYAKDKLTDAHFSVLRKVLETTRGMRRLGSAAVDLCYVACGRFGGYYELTLNPWDVAAGGLIVAEAGGIVTDIYGENTWMDGKSILACSSSLEKDFMTLTKDFRI